MTCRKAVFNLSEEVESGRHLSKLSCPT